MVRVFPFRIIIIIIITLRIERQGGHSSNIDGQTNKPNQTDRKKNNYEGIFPNCAARYVPGTLAQTVAEYLTTRSGRVSRRQRDKRTQQKNIVTRTR